jgi:hypothetical protein
VNSRRRYEQTKQAMIDNLQKEQENRRLEEQKSRDELKLALNTMTDKMTDMMTSVCNAIQSMVALSANAISSQTSTAPIPTEPTTPIPIPTEPTTPIPIPTEPTPPIPIPTEPTTPIPIPTEPTPNPTGKKKNPAKKVSNVLYLIA